MHAFARNVASSQPVLKFLGVLKSLESALSVFFSNRAAATHSGDCSRGI